MYDIHELYAHIFPYRGVDRVINVCYGIYALGHGWPAAAGAGV